MKIGIITQPLHYNYGGLLQNYALQQVLKNMGHEVVTLDQHNPKTKVWKIYASWLKTFIVNLFVKDKKRQYSYLLNKSQERYIKQHTDDFIRKYIKHSGKLNTKNDFLNYSTTSGIDALVVGSDQVWRPRYNMNILRSFLDFAVNLDIKRIAYAASFGVDEWEYTEKQTLQSKNLIKLFNAVSVRENSGIALCQKYLECQAACVLDPTMLLDSNDYIKLVHIENEKQSDGNLFTYILDRTIVKEDIINKVASRLGLQPFSVMPNEVNAKAIKDIDSCVYPSPTKWLRAFMDANFVVCDSFHGAVFSIIFNKPFIVIGNAKRGLTRFTSLLKMFSLENRLVKGGADLYVIEESIDWISVNEKRNELKSFSISYLFSSLNDSYKR